MKKILTIILSLTFLTSYSQIIKQTGIGLTYDTDENGLQKAIDILKKIQKENEDTEDKTVISFDAFNDSALNIVFIYYIKKGADIMDTQTAMNLQILKQFNENKLEFAFPTQTIFTQQNN